MPYPRAHYYVLIVIAVIAVGFWPSYFGAWDEARWQFHAHGIAASLWVIMVFAQSWTAHHRQLAAAPRGRPDQPVPLPLPDRRAGRDHRRDRQTLRRRGRPGAADVRRLLPDRHGRRDGRVRHGLLPGAQIPAAGVDPCRLYADDTAHPVRIAVQPGAQHVHAGPGHRGRRRPPFDHDLDPLVDGARTGGDRAHLVEISGAGGALPRRGRVHRPADRDDGMDGRPAGAEDRADGARAGAERRGLGRGLRDRGADQLGRLDGGPARARSLPARRCSRPERACQRARLGAIARR